MRSKQTAFARSASTSAIYAHEQLGCIPGHKEGNATHIIPEVEGYGEASKVDTTVATKTMLIGKDDGKDMILFQAGRRVAESKLSTSFDFSHGFMKRLGHGHNWQSIV